VEAGPSLLEYVNQRFADMQRAADKAQEVQAAHNIAANEWRATLNDFKAGVVNRVEFERLQGEFSAYKLEVARILAATAGEKTGSRDVGDTSKWLITTVIALVALAVAVLWKHG